MAMRRISVAEARERFRDLLDELSNGGFFLVESGHALPLGVMLDREACEQVFAQQDEWLRAAIAEADADIAAGRVEPLTDELIERIEREGRERLERTKAEREHAA
jgi:PHD/YefM family antitoxin component YafN of YafNO toxin-antitoxin module